MTKRSLLGIRYSRVGSFHEYLKEPIRAAARQRIIEEIIGQKPLHDFPCLCGNSDRDVLLATIDRWGLPCSSLLCKYCGIIRVNPRWNDDVYSTIYSDLYWQMAMGQVDINQKRFDLSVRRASPYADYILRNVDLSGKNVLEIGCSYGAGLHVLKSTGAHLIGYDYDQRMLDAGRCFTGLDLRYGGVVEALKEGGRYDLVILRHVFEHMLHPNAELALLKRLLREYGMLFIEVPGVLNHASCSPDPIVFLNVFHAYGYTLDNLACIMRANGFRCVKGDEAIHSLWQYEVDGTVPSWCNPKLVKKIVHHLFAMERARRLAFLRATVMVVPEWLSSILRRREFR